MEQRIVCAALRLGDRIVCGVRHFDRIMHDQIGGENWKRAEQGFVDNRGVFYNRQEAWILAQQKGQIRNSFRCSAGTLFSEHLY